jgi:hypothetical protein
VAAIKEFIDLRCCVATAFHVNRAFQVFHPTALPLMFVAEVCGFTAACVSFALQKNNSNMSAAKKKFRLRQFYHEVCVAHLLIELRTSEFLLRYLVNWTINYRRSIDVKRTAQR